ncbi:AaceriACR001Cp [[Ashbya] aceris (nom. inval.)]|nr:AaceriACR001Cp [[Ashbya] aceris (nom. inval.)]
MSVHTSHGASEGVTEMELPRQFLSCSRTYLVVLISRMLSSLIGMNDAQGDKSKPIKLTRFHSRVPPAISVYNYLIRLTKYSSLEHCVLLASVYYIDLLTNVYPEFRLDSLTVHRFLLTATTVASKGLCDSFCTNTHYAKVGGVQCSELNVLENEFLERVNYRILPRDDNIRRCSLERQEGIFSYSNIPMDKDCALQDRNNGFGVLEKYYHRMIHLIGDFNMSPDKSCNLSFTLDKKPVDSIQRTITEGVDFQDANSDNSDSGNRLCSKSTNNVSTSQLASKEELRSVHSAYMDNNSNIINGSPQSFSRKRNYSDSSINHLGMCTQLILSKKHSNSQNSHSPREIV